MNNYSTLSLRLGDVAFIKSFLFAFTGSVLLAVSAKTQINLLPVPITLQTFVLFFIAYAFGAKLAGATVLLYLFEGILGFPVFAKGGGFAHIIGPTGGYLVGFFVSAVIMGYLAEKGWDQKFLFSILGAIIGTVVIYSLGIAWLSYQIGFEKAIQFGLYPFLAGDAIKICLLGILFPLVSRFLKKKEEKNN